MSLTENQKYIAVRTSIVEARNLRYLKYAAADPRAKNDRSDDTRDSKSHGSVQIGKSTRNIGHGPQRNHAHRRVVLFMRDQYVFCHQYVVNVRTDE